MLEQHEIPFTYRDYRKEPLSVEEIRRLLRLLSMEARQLLRRRDRAYRELALSGDESEAEIIRLMSEHPTLLQRPIGVRGDRAAVGRPPENLLQLGDE